MASAITFKGRDIETLNREDLLEALHWAYDALNTERRMATLDREMDRLFTETGAAIRALRRPA